MAMTKKHYEIVAGSIYRSGIIADKNKIRQEAREKMRRLIAIDICANLAHNDDKFNKDKFLKECGL